MRAARMCFSALGIMVSVALVLGACAKRIDRTTTGGNATAGWNTESASPSPSSEPEPILQGDLLANPYSYGDGFIRFDPPPSNYSPSISAASALAAFEATGLYGGNLQGKSRQEFLADYRGYEGATSVSSVSGDLQPSAQMPAWVILYESVPDSVSGAGCAKSSESCPSAPVVLHDIIAIVDADTGMVEQVTSDLPDQTPQGPPTSQQAKPSGEA